MIVQGHIKASVYIKACIDCWNSFIHIVHDRIDTAIFSNKNLNLEKVRLVPNNCLKCQIFNRPVSFNNFFQGVKWNWA